MQKIVLLNQQSMCPIPSLDSSFVDRLVNWQYIYRLSKHFNFLTAVPTYSWPEILFLNFPNTINVDNGIFFDNDSQNYININQSEIVDPKIFITKLIKEKNLFKNGNCVHLKYDTHSLRNNIIFDKSISYFPPIFNEIKFKKKEVNNFFVKNFSDMIAIQLRRGVGTYPTRQHYNELRKYIPDKIIKSYYFNTLLANSRPLYHIESDAVYFAVIDRIIKNNPDQKIYLSFDVPKLFINHYLEKYPKNIVIGENYLSEYLIYFNEFDIKNTKSYRVSLRNTLKMLLDFFAMNNSKGIVCNNVYMDQSSWIWFARNYKPKQIYNMFDS